ncbi:MAG: hypothetical protein MI806_33660, partial [Minwuiales bacterium]|nr:hypothetical protein [Minwuiales bacterium]
MPSVDDPTAAPLVPETAAVDRPHAAGFGPPSLIGLDRAELAEALADIGEPESKRKMRANQLFHWIYHRGARDFDEMTSIAKDLRARLAETYTLARPEIVDAQRSMDGTRKWLMRFPDGNEVESVYIPETDRGALCVS